MSVSFLVLNIYVINICLNTQGHQVYDCNIVLISVKTLYFHLPMILNWSLSHTYIFSCNHTSLLQSYILFALKAAFEWISYALHKWDSNWRLNIRLPMNQMESRCAFSSFMRESMTTSLFFDVVGSVGVKSECQWFWVGSEWGKAIIMYVNIIADPEPTGKLPMDPTKQTHPFSVLICLPCSAVL